jgi:RNA polymerase sigma-70 factor (ECF subfamily)
LAGTVLLHRVAAGEQAAIDELLSRFGGLVYALARRLSLDQSEVEDAVQEIFVAIWQSAGRYDPALGTEETFVAMVTRRRLIDRRRRAVRRAMPTIDADLGAIVSERDSGRGGSASAGAGCCEGGGAAEQQAEFSELSAKAEELLRGLRPEQQTAIRLSIFQGLSHEQIARLTGSPLGTVKTHVRRGLIALREAMEAIPANARTRSGGGGPE